MATPRPETSPASLSLRAVIAWLLIQLFALMLGVFRVPLAARFAAPGEQFALHEVLAAQIVAASLLFPVLMPNWRTAAVILLTAVPFAQLGAFLSNTPVDRWSLAAAYACAWIVILAVLGAAARGFDLLRAPRDAGRTFVPLFSASAVAIASGTSLGGAALWYVQAEFGTSSSAALPNPDRYGPLAGALSQAGQAQLLRDAWAVLVASLTIATVFLLLASILRRRASRGAEE